ncbi:hypothetical protein AAG906_034314 [Vitis piasezkii]
MDGLSHVYIFPFSVQGHLNAMLKLTELLCLGGLQVTFLNSNSNYHRLLCYSSSILDRFTRYPGFRFETISDGLPMEHPRTDHKDIFDGLRTTTKPLFREKMISWCQSSETHPPVTCIIADGILTFAIDVADEVGVPLLFSVLQVLDFSDDVTYPVFSGPITWMTHLSIGPERASTNSTNQRSHNTFEDLEGPVLSQIRNHCPKAYAIGPLHEHLKSRLASETTMSQSSNSLWEEDKTCIAWLDRQPLKSVIYVSFGSLVVIKKDELTEFWYGLVNSGSHFLWRRPDTGGTLGRNKERGLLVSWAPQEEVLAHPAVGAFLTHSGWNSTLEGITAGVPMICWPRFGDQQINSRFVSHVWKLGIDMKDTCDRITIEKMVGNLMEEKRAEFMKSADSM